MPVLRDEEFAYCLQTHFGWKTLEVLMALETGWGTEDEESVAWMVRAMVTDEVFVY